MTSEIHQEMTLMPELREHVPTVKAWLRLYGAYVGMSRLAEGSSQEVSIFEMFHTL